MGGSNLQHSSRQRRREDPEGPLGLEDVRADATGMRITRRETTKMLIKRTGSMGAATVVTNHVGVQQKRG